MYILQNDTRTLQYQVNPKYFAANFNLYVLFWGRGDKDSVLNPTRQPATWTVSRSEGFFIQLIMSEYNMEYREI